MNHPASSPPAACDVTPSRSGSWRTRWTPPPASPGDASDCPVVASDPIVVHYRHEEDEDDEQHG